MVVHKMSCLYGHYKALRGKEKDSQETMQFLKANLDMTQTLKLSGRELQVTVVNM